MPVQRLKNIPCRGRRNPQSSDVQHFLASVALTAPRWVDEARVLEVILEVVNVDFSTIEYLADTIADRVSALYSTVTKVVVTMELLNYMPAGGSYEVEVTRRKGK